MLCATDFLELAISGCFLVFQRTRAPFSCHVRAHQHVFALQCAVSASEWNFCAHFLRTFIPFWPDFVANSRHFHVMYCSSSSFLHTKVQFRPQSGIFVHTFIPSGPILSPSGPILWLQPTFSCHVRAHQHVFAHQCAVSASEWNFVSCFLALLSPFGPILGLDLHLQCAIL